MIIKNIIIKIDNILINHLLNFLRKFKLVLSFNKSSDKITNPITQLLYLFYAKYIYINDANKYKNINENPNDRKYILKLL